MILYHGSNTIIERVELSKCRPYKDFGQGFYLTQIKEQALLMAKRTATIYGGEPVVTEFEFNEDMLHTLSVKQFKEPDKEWALFVLDNRNREVQHPIHNYDIVIGPVADDTIATLFRNFTDGIIDIDMLVSGLKYKSVSSQYLFHSEESLKHLLRR